MADAVASAPAPAAAPAAAPAPAVTAPAAAPAAPASAPAAAPAPAAAVPAAPAADDPNAPLQSLLKDEPGEKTDEQKAADAAAAATALAESYELTPPEGLNLPDEAIAGVKAKLAAAGVPADQAQNLFAEYTNAAKVAGEAAIEASMKAWVTTQKEWQAEIKADPDIGGAKLDANLAQLAKGAHALLGNEGWTALKQALDLTGAGNNPAVVKSLYKAFAIHAPATPVSGTPAAQREPRTAGATLYPKQAGLGNASIN